MSDYLTVIGIDPGPIPGLCVLEYAGLEMIGARALQCSAAWIDELVDNEIRGAEYRVPTGFDVRLLVSIERYTPRRGQGKRLAAGANQQTQEMAAGLVARLRQDRALSVVSYPPATVMPWATDEKLRLAKLWDLTTGCAHARSAARHALYCAVKDGGMRNPLSKRNPDAEGIIARAHAGQLGDIVPEAT